MQVKNLSTESEIAQSYEVFLELRPHFYDVQSFTKQVEKQQKEGYKISAVFEQEEIIACTGFRIMNLLVHGKILYIDDLVTKEKYRGKGYGKILLDHISKIAKDKNCTQIHLDSSYTRYSAHKLYLKYGFELNAHHFALKLVY